jgi:hypothetical protein
MRALTIAFLSKMKKKQKRFSFQKRFSMNWSTFLPRKPHTLKWAISELEEQKDYQANLADPPKRKKKQDF